MKYLNSIFYCLLLSLCCSFSYGQMEKYEYKRALEGVSEPWHKITVPNELYAKAASDLRDIRIFGLTKDNDTIEAPYLLRISSDKVVHQEVTFNTLNVSHNEQYHYYTFEVPTKEAINQIELNFKQRNFDWQVWLEGSQDQQEWFTILEDYRMLSIKNEKTDFKFTSLNFPSSKYRFFRLRIESKEQPIMMKASIAQHEVKSGRFRKYKIKKINIKEDKQSKQTKVDIELDMAVRISHINIAVADTFDYYRPITLKYLTDSVKTERGWHYNYRTLSQETLNSIEKNEFELNSTTVKKLSLLIYNGDNQPLVIDSIEVKGHIHKLVARFTKPARYYLTYGHETVRTPHYDIARFEDHIPENLQEVGLGNELNIKKEQSVMTEPIFKNKIWLWAVMTVVILLIGWFSINMIRKNE